MQLYFSHSDLRRSNKDLATMYGVSVEDIHMFRKYLEAHPELMETDGPIPFDVPDQDSGYLSTQPCSEQKPPFNAPRSMPPMPPQCEHWPPEVNNGYWVYQDSYGNTWWYLATQDPETVRRAANVEIGKEGVELVRSIFNLIISVDDLLNRD